MDEQHTQEVDRPTADESPSSVAEVLSRQAHEQRFEAAIQALNRRHAKLLEEAVGQLRAERDATRDQVANLDRDLNAAYDRIRVLDGVIAELHGSVNNLSASLSAAEAGRDQLQGRLNRLRTRWYGPFLLRVLRLGA